MPISPADFPALQELHNGEYATSVVFNRPHFALSTRTNSLKTLLEAVESEIVTARDSYASLDARLDAEIHSSILNDRHLFLTGGPVSWHESTGSFTYGRLTIIQPNKTYNYIIDASSVSSIADGECLYVVLDRNPVNPLVDVVLLMQKCAIHSLPDSIDIYSIGVRYGTRFWLRGSGELEDGESREIGDGMTDALLGRLEMSDENDTASHFTHITTIGIGDTIPAAISKLDNQADNLVEDRNSLFVSVANFTWNVSGTGTLSWDDTLKIRVPNIGDVTVSATSIGSIAADEVLYLTVDRAQTGSYTRTLTKCATGSLPLSAGNMDNIVVGFRYDDKFVFRTGDVLQNGEVKQIGLGGGGLKIDEDRMMFVSSDNDVIWDALAGQITCTGDLTIHLPWTSPSITNIIKSTEFPISLSTTGRKAYVVLNRKVQSDLTVIDDVDYVPITYSVPDVHLIAERVGDAVYIFKQRWNDQDKKRIGEGFVAGVIYNEVYEVTNPAGEATITLPNSGTNPEDGKTLQVWANGVDLDAGIDGEYIETSPTQITANVCEMFPDGKFPYLCKLKFRVDSIVTGGAGPGGGGGAGSLQDAYLIGRTITAASGLPVVFNGTVGQKIATFNGDIDVTGIIDPKGIELTTQSVNPNAAKNLLWVNATGDMVYNNLSTGVSEVVSNKTGYKTYTNNSGTSLPKGRAVRISGTGTVGPANWTSNELSRVIGITLNDAADGEVTSVQKYGYVESGIITSSCFIEAALPAEGERVFLSSTSGQLTVTPPGTGTGYYEEYLGIWDEGGLNLQIAFIGIA